MASKWVFCSKDNKDNFEEQYYNRGLLPDPSNDGTNKKVKDLKAGDQIVVYSPDRANGSVFVFGIAEWIASVKQDGCYRVIWKKLILDDVIKDSNRGLNGQTKDIEINDWALISNWNV